MSGYGGLFQNNNGLLMGLSEAVNNGLRAFDSERDRADKRQYEEEKLGLLRQKIEAAANAKKSENQNVEGLMNQLYPGEFKSGSFESLSPGTISNVFKTKRQREAIAGRERATRGGPGLMGGGGRSPQEVGPGQMLGTDKSQWLGVPAGGWDLRAVERYQKMLLSASKKIDAAMDAASGVENLADMATTNPTAAAAVPVAMARASMDSGVLSNQDIKRWGGSQALLARLNRSATLLASGTLPPQDAAFLKEVASAMMAGHKKAKAAIAKDIVGKYSSNYGGSPEQNWKLITGGNQEVDVPTVKSKQYSPSRNQTRIQYSDGTTKVLDGKQ